METTLQYGTLELRQDGGRRRIRGRFPYGATATVSSRGKVRKERFEPHSLSFAIRDETRPIHLLFGHDYNRPLAVRAPASAPVGRATIPLVLKDTDEAVEVETEELPEDLEELPTYFQDVLKLIELGLSVGLSPGFQVPPLAVVPGAEELIPEPGNPDILIRSIVEAVLFEMSIVTRPAYIESMVDLRSQDFRTTPRRRRVWL